MGSGEDMNRFADLLAMIGIAICLGLDPRGLLQHYPSLPEALVPMTSIVLWIWLVALLIDLLVQGYRLGEQRAEAMREG